MSELESFQEILYTYNISPGSSTILDIGCGNGKFTLQLGRIFKKVVTIDISQDVIDKLKVKIEEEKLTNVTGNCNCLLIKVEINQVKCKFKY